MRSAPDAGGGGGQPDGVSKPSELSVSFYPRRRQRQRCEWRC
jgi:hypothetical protein